MRGVIFQNAISQTEQWIFVGPSVFCRWSCGGKRNLFIKNFCFLHMQSVTSAVLCKKADNRCCQLKATNSVLCHVSIFTVTGASFVVFNGALKTSSGFLAKSSIVEGMHT